MTKGTGNNNKNDNEDDIKNDLNDNNNNNNNDSVNYPSSINQINSGHNYIVNSSNTLHLNNILPSQSLNDEEDDFFFSENANQIKFLGDEDNNFNYDEIVDIVDPRVKTVTEGRIVSVRGDLFIVEDTETREQKNVYRNDNLILRQWHPGRPFQIFNRIDFCLSGTNYWVVGVISNINQEKNLLFVKFHDQLGNPMEEWVHVKSERIDKVGTHTRSLSSDSNKQKEESKLEIDEINKNFFKNRKIIKLSQNLEENFRNNIQRINFFIKDVQGDGNCLFRAVSDQVYGNENFHMIIREKCMDYIQAEREFFEKFIEGNFDKYIEMKRKSGVWGDDVELQAISEIYNRPIEIYSGDTKPLKTFHENEDSFKNADLSQTGKNLKKESLSNLSSRQIEGNQLNLSFNPSKKKKKIYPIRLSYHGGEHYNSIIPTKMNFDVWTSFKNALISLKPGVFEEAQILSLVNNKKQNKEEASSLNSINEASHIDKSRELFIKQKDKYIDDLLYQIVEDEKKNNVKFGKTNSEEIGDVTKYNEEYQKLDDDLIDKVIKESLKQEYIGSQTPEQNMTSEIDYMSNPTVQAALECGFSLDDAIEAWTIYGTNQDLALQYLLSTRAPNV